MLKAEQVPTEAINAYMHMIVYGGVDGAEAIAAALNAWPGMDTGPNIYGRQDAIIHLPLTENADAEA